ncbi:MAG: hypothetical protein ACYSUI_12905 [Planctomycetota bacterium]
MSGHLNRTSQASPPDWRRLACRIVALAVGACCVLAAVAAAADDEPRVRIDGGADTWGNYEWTVTNNYRSPIVYVEFPHYRADGFSAPPGWSTKCRHLVGAATDEQGPPMCSASAAAPDLGISRGGSATFQMRIAPSGAHRGSGQVTIRFAGGETATVAGVQLPGPEPAAEKYARLIGFGVLFVVFLIARAIWVRRRRSGHSADPAIS